MTFEVTTIDFIPYGPPGAPGAGVAFAIFPTPGAYFDLNDDTPLAPNPALYYVWYTTGPEVDPTPLPPPNGIMVLIGVGDSSDVIATKTAAAIAAFTDPSPPFGSIWTAPAPAPLATLITVTNISDGPVTDASAGTMPVPGPPTILTTIQGALPSSGTQPLIHGSQVDGSTLASVDADTLGGLSVGTSPFNVVALNGSSGLPAVDGSLLTGLPPSGLGDVVDDISPQLGGNLDINGNSIVSTGGANIAITPDTTGNVSLGVFDFNADQSVGAGQDNFVLTYDNSTGLINLEVTSGGGGDVFKVGTPVNDQVAVWTGDGTVEGTTGVTYSGSLLDVTGTIDSSVEYLFTERAAHSFTPAATRGILWVRNDIPNTLIFTNDAGTDFDLTDTGGAGDVGVSGTPVDNQLAVWTGAATIEGTTGLVYDGSLLDVTGTIDASVEYLFTERAAHSFTPAATRGILWVRSDAPNVLVFTDDAGTDNQLATAGFAGIISTASATLTLDATHFTVVATLAGAQTFTLPTAVGIAGRIYNIKKTGASGLLTVDGDGTETIDGALTFTTSTQYESVTVQSDGSNWIII